jgi:C1A family cysteine protease
MPIRIKRDEDQGSYNPRTGGGSGGGGGGLIQFLPMLLGLFGRNPKMLILVAVVGGIIYMMGGKGCSSVTDPSQANSSAFSTGADFDIKKYAATEIYEPLSNNKSNPLPERISLEKFAPNRKNQGQQGSCVAWASAYAARSIMQARESGADPNQSTFSPSFLYNQIALEGCQGSYLNEALKVMQTKGLAPFNDMPYTDQDCSAKPSQFQLQKASDYKIDGYQRLTGGRNGEDATKVNMVAIKQNIAQGAPVVIGMMVGGTFMQNMMGQEMWQSTDGDRQMSGFGGHAMCVIGYDDYKFAQNMGGFQIMNSWGTEWGKNGMGWVSYDDFEYFAKEAYGVYPMGDAAAIKTSILNAQLGVVAKANGENIALQQTSNFNFTTARKLNKNEEFKLEVVNNIECYVYVFGMETDGSTYRLFPYTEKHSPFCGITGRRLFPRDYSMYPDEVGNADYFAIIVSKTALDYDEFDKKLDSAPGATYGQKVASVVGSMNGVQMQAGKNISLTADLNSVNMIGAVIEVTK